MTPLADAFMSYSRADSAIADELLRLLKARGKQILFDKSDIHGGEDWRRKLATLIERANSMIVLVSPASLSSSECTWENEHAATLNKRLIPVLVGGVPTTTLPKSVNAIQWIDAANNPDLALVAEQIVEAIDTDQEWAEYHTQLTARVIAYNKTGSLLDTKDQRAAERMFAKYVGKRPFPTEAQSDLLKSSQKASTRRRRRVAGILIVVSIVIAGLAISSYVEQRNAAYINLRRAGEQALATLDNGDVPAAITSLAGIILADKQQILPEYRDIFNFWQPRLIRFDELANGTTDEEILSAPRGHFMKVGPNDIRALPVKAPFLATTLPRSKHLLVAEFSGVSLLDRTGFKTILHLDFPFRVTPVAMYEIPNRPWILVEGTRVKIENDEHEISHKDTCFTLVITAAGASPGPRIERTGIVDPEYVKPIDPLPSIKGDAGTAAHAFCMYKSFKSFRFSSSPAGDALLLEGPKENHVEAADSFNVIRLDALTGQAIVEARREVKDSDTFPLPTALPPNRIRLFPDLRPELKSWTAGPLIATSAWGKTFEDEETCERVSGYVAKADFSGIGEADVWRRRLAPDHVRLSPKDDCGVIQDKDTMLLTAWYDSGNSSKSLAACSLTSSLRVLSCQDMSFLAIRTWTIPSSDRRWIAHGTEHSEGKTLELVDVVRMQRFELENPPPDLVMQGAFNASGTQFAALTQAGDVFFYALEPNRSPILKNRVTIAGFVRGKAADAASDGPGALAFIADRAIVVTDGQTILLGIDADTAQTQWRRPFSPEPSRQKLVAAADGPFFVVWGSALQLFHATSGTPLSNAIDSSALASLAGAEDGVEDGIVVMGNGDIAVRFGNQVAIRERPRLSDIQAEAAGIERRTGIAVAPPVK